MSEAEHLPAERGAARVLLPWALLVAMGQTNRSLHERYFGDSRERRPGQSQRTNSSSSL